MAQRPARLKQTLTLWQVVVMGLAYMTPMVVFDTFGIVTDITQGHVTTAYLLALVGVLFTATSLFGFISIMHMPLPEFTAVVATTPLCVTVVAALWLHQRVSRWRWLLVAMGLAGTMAIIRPGSDTFTWALL